jgi:ribonuclease J
MIQSDELVFLPLGGVGEIGMNVALYGFGPPDARQWIMVDCGVTFGDVAETPGIDLILPDIRFAVAERANLLGLILTHAHEDHFGAVLDLWPQLGVPVYATPFTAGLLAAKAAGEPGAPTVPVEVVPVGGRIRLGPFEVEFVPVAHSIPEPNALAIRTGAGLVVHTGDWKLDPQPTMGPGTDPARFRALGDEGVIAVMADSTNAVRAGRSPSETEVAATLAELILTAPGRVAVTTFASHVPRVKSIAAAARAAGREVVIAGRALVRTISVAREAGLLDGVPPFLGADAFERLQPDKVVALVTGSQGEGRAALARIAADTHPQLRLAAGDRLILSSRTIPGNERPVNRIVNAMIDRGVEVVTDRTRLVHVSGHPRRDEMADLYGWLRPQTVVPVHGEPLHLFEHAALARRLGIPHVAEIRNGDVLKLWPGRPEIVDEAPVGRIHKDGRVRLSADDTALADRRWLAVAGVVSIAVAIDAQGEPSGAPEVALTGLPERDVAGDDIEEIVREVVEDLLEELPRGIRRDPEALAKALRRAVRAELALAWGKKPTCHVLVLTR